MGVLLYLGAVPVSTSMTRLTSEEIDELVNTYWDSQRDEEQSLEKRLVDELPYSTFLTRESVESVIRWKTLTQGGRSIRFIGELQSVSDEEIVLVTNCALSINRLRSQIDVLQSLPGVGPGVATSILGFVFPETHVVVDYNVYNGVFDESKDSISDKQAVDLIHKLRETYQDSGYSLRDIDRALFVKYGGFGD